MVAGAKQEFAGGGVSFLEKYGFYLGIEGFPAGIEGSIVCRLKRLDEVGASRSYPTPRALAIRSNKPEIDGLPADATIVDVGYVLNGLRTGYSDVQVVRVAGTAFVMSVPEEEDQTYLMPRGLFESEPGSNSGSAKRFNIMKKKKSATDRPEE